MGIIWIIVIGFVAGIIARLLSPGPNKPSGFILTALLGIVEPSLRRLSARLSAGTAQIRGLDLLAQQWGR